MARALYCSLALVIFMPFFMGCSSSFDLTNSSDSLTTLAVTSTVKLQNLDGYLTEGQPSETVKVVLSQVQQHDVVIDVFYTGTYDASDFESLPAHVTIPAGQSQVSLGLKTVDDAIVEPYKQVNIRLRPETANLVVESEVYSYELRDNDAAYVSVKSIENEYMLEGGDLSTRVTIQVRKSIGGGGINPSVFGSDELKDDNQPLGFELKMQLIQIAGNLSQDDIVQSLSSITIPADQTEITISYQAKQDSLVEGFESGLIKYKLVNAFAGSSIQGNTQLPSDSDLQFELRVLDDDIPTIYLSKEAGSCSDSDLKEADSPTCKISLIRSGDLAKSLSLQLDYSQGTAVLGSDFVGPTTVTFSSGQSALSVDLRIINDSLYESSETLIVNMVPADGLGCNCNQNFVYNILDNDASPEGRSIEVKAIANLESEQVQLSWSTELNYLSYKIYRREFGSSSWGAVRANVPVGQLSYVDKDVVLGKLYEYKVERSNGVGFVTAAYNTPPTHWNGRVLIIGESTVASKLNTEIEVWRSQIAAEGWDVLYETAPKDETVIQIKNRILNHYREPLGLRAVILFGHLAVPYSGDFAPDGHSNHFGAWPADVFFGDVQSDLWTDVSIDRVTASRIENRNIPGDGKYDQSRPPSDVEIAIGRIDLTNMSAFAPLTEVDLLGRYLQKMTDYRSAKFIPNRRALIDDNFGDFGGEAFASSAWNWFGSIVGKENTFVKDWMTELGTQNYLWAYGCGGGSYNSASGIGVTADFATIPINAVFTSLFGSYFGDWDSPNNFLRAPLAAPGHALTSVWSGRPKWVFHAMASGVPLSSVILQNLNNTSYDQTAYDRGVHMALMGDPTLKDYVYMGVQNLQALVTGYQAKLSWEDSYSDGYYVYVSTEKHAGYRLVNKTAIKEKNVVVDLNSNEKYIMVRGVRTQTSYGGTFQNLSAGTIIAL